MAMTEQLQCADCDATFPRKGRAIKRRCDGCQRARERMLERQRYSPEVRHQKHARRMLRDQDATALRIAAHKEKQAAKRAEREATNSGLVDAALSGGCCDCGEMDRVVLEFDHVRGTKMSTPTVFMATKDLRAELAKCEVRCANCHRRRHHRERTEAGRQHRKLTDVQVDEITALYATGWHVRDIGAAYGITFSYVGKLAKERGRRRTVDHRMHDYKEAWR